jgi:hypothetical protein
MNAKTYLASRLMSSVTFATALLTTPLTAEIKETAMRGYMCLSTEQVPAKYDAGFSVYVAAWPLLENYPGHEFQTGLFGTWMFPKGDDPEHKKLYTDIEGGLGWWRDTRFPTATPKFIMGGVAPDFSEIANGPAHGAGTWEDPKGLYGVAQLSPWLLFPIDGLNVKQGTCGDLFGYGYLPLPLTLPKTVTAGKNLPTGDQSWTLFLNTGNFKGPVAFFTPYFWSRSIVKNPTLAGRLLDSSPTESNKSFQMETQYIPASVIAHDAKGNSFARTAPLRFPVNDGKNSVMMHGLRTYSKRALWDHVKTWFDGGKEASGTFNPSGIYLESFRKDCYSTWNIQLSSQTKDKETLIEWTQFAKPIFKDPHTFAYCWNPKFVQPTTGNMVSLPDHYQCSKQAGQQQWIAKKADQLPDELRRIKFETPQEKAQDPYDSPETPESSFKSPGPVKGPFKAHLGDHSVVTYYWYRFADQPALLNADLTKEEREQIQTKVEKLHRAWTKEKEYLPPPKLGKLADLDPAQLVTPPKGFEIGYVPIATRQELDKTSPR